mgnify:CR=1 FL=1
MNTHECATEYIHCSRGNDCRYLIIDNVRQIYLIMKSKFMSIYLLKKLPSKHKYSTTVQLLQVDEYLMFVLH